MDESLGELES